MTFTITAHDVGTVAKWVGVAVGSFVAGCAFILVDTSEGAGRSVATMNDDTLASYLGNFVHGFDDATQRRHLRKRGWIEYVHKSWNLSQGGYAEAFKRELLPKPTVVKDLT